MLKVVDMKLGNPLFIAALALAMFGAACGGNYGRQQAPLPVPTFTTTPPTAAAEGQVYTYTVNATSPGGLIGLSLTSGPAGAVMSGGVLTWTPTAGESRVANSFSVTASTTGGGTAVQSWSVTPTGTVTVTRVDTVWSASGSTSIPFDWTLVAGLNAGIIVLQADGTLQTLTGTGNANGTLTIPNVPGGYYWLKLLPMQTYWTSTSNFDAGANIIAESIAGTTSETTTTFDSNVSGLDPWQIGDLVTLNLDSGILLEGSGLIAVGATNATTTASINSNIDFSKVQSAYIGQEENISLGTLQASVLGPTAKVTNLALTNGATNTITVTLTPSPKSSLNLTVNGSDWVNLYNNAAPAAGAPLMTTMGITAQPYFKGGVAEMGGLLNTPVPALFLGGEPIFPALPALTFSGEVCSDVGFTEFGVPQPPGRTAIVTNTNFGAFQYGDPFEQDWPRLFSFCQEAEVSIPDPGSTTPVTILMSDGLITGVPTGPVEPLVGVVQNPTINGVSLFTVSTFKTGAVNLSWSAPSGGSAPTGYIVQVLQKTTLPPSPPPAPQNPLTMFEPIATVFTTKTTMALPYALVAGDVFLVKIVARVDGQANFESSPNRFGVPIGSASVISAVMTVGPMAMVKQGQIVRSKPTANAATIRTGSGSQGIRFQGKP
jgi:hypothetical protein